MKKKMFLNDLETIRDDYEEMIGHETDFNIFMAITHLFEKYDLKAGDLEFVGSGNYGSAYADKNKDLIVKITNDDTEIMIAKSLIGHENNYIADIYGVYDLNEKYSLIIQERLNTDNTVLHEARLHLLDILDEKNVCFQEIIKGEFIEDILKEDLFLGEWCFDYCFKIINDAYSAFAELKAIIDIESDDFHLFNMGIKKNGNIGFFDQTIY